MRLAICQGITSMSANSTYIHNWSLQPFCQDCNLAVRPLMLCASNFLAHYRLCAAAFHRWLHEYFPLKRQLSLACRRNTYL